MYDAGVIKEHVRGRYGAIAVQSDGVCCGQSCCCGSDISARAMDLGYTMDELSRIPADAFMGLGCGNPTAMADLKEGETVLDLGSGGGIDAFLAAVRAGPSGRIIGVDMTPGMVELANRNAREGGFDNVEFRLGEIEDLPVEDGSIDTIVSNCVINLSPDKSRVFKEAHRVLKPGGRILVSDIATAGALPEDVRNDPDAWTGCIAGAMDRDDYLATIREAGFRDVNVVGELAYAGMGDSRLDGKVFSVQVEAFK